MQSVSQNPLIATFKLSSAASLTVSKWCIRKWVKQHNKVNFKTKYENQVIFLYQARCTLMIVVTSNIYNSCHFYRSTILWSDGITIKLDEFTICLYLDNPKLQSRTRTSISVHLLSHCVFTVAQYRCSIPRNPAFSQLDGWTYFKTLWEKGKMLVNSFFPLFSMNVFCPF